MNDWLVSRVVQVQAPVLIKEVGVKFVIVVEEAVRDLCADLLPLMSLDVLLGYADTRLVLTHLLKCVLGEQSPLHNQVQLLSL